MKTMSVVLLTLAVLLTVGVADSQTVASPSIAKPFLQPVYTAKAYVNSQIDTSAIFNIGGCSRVSLLTISYDSTSYITNVDYRPSSSAAWVATSADTVAVVAGGAVSYHSWVLRDNTTEKVPGMSGQIRFRKVFAASNNGVTAPTYTDQLYWKP